MTEMEHMAELELLGETEVLGENLPEYHFVHQKSHMTRPGSEARPKRKKVTE
jgi:hypothetical protein